MPRPSTPLREPVAAWVLVSRSDRGIRRYASVLHHVYSRMMGGSVLLEDVVQQAYLGAFRAAQLFDETRGLAFMTFAAFWVRSYVQRLFRQRHGLTKVDSETRLERYSFVEGSGYSDNQNGSRRASKVPQWLLDLLPPGEGALDLLDRLEKLESVDAALEGTDPRWRHILEQRFIHGRTLAEVSRDLGTCREWVRQLEQEALEHLRQQLIEGGEFCPSRQSARMTACRDRISSNTSKNA